MSAQGPLSGIRVLEIAAYISGPYAGAILSSLGAEVIKVEPKGGDAFRIGMGTGSPYFSQFNAGKRSIAIDLKAPSGVAAIKAMLPTADVLIENMRPGKLAALGLGKEVCQGLNPSLVYTSISGFGSGGPWVDRPAYDSIGQSLGGLLTVLNDEGNAQQTGTCLADLITAVGTTVSILAALVARERAGNGKGLHIETSVFEAVSLLTVEAMTQALVYDLDPVRNTRNPQSQSFCPKTASGESLTVHLSSSDRFWRSLTKVVEREDLLQEPRFATYASRAVPENYWALVAIIKEEFLKQPLKVWEQRLIDEDVPFAPALKLRELAVHPQMQWADLLQSSSDGKPLMRVPWRFDGQRPERGRDVPQIGEHTRDILQEVLSTDEVEALAKSGGIAS